MAVWRAIGLVGLVGLLAPFSSRLPANAAASDPVAVPPGCGDRCVEGGRISFDHPTWGPSELIVAWNPSAGSCHFTAVDGAGVERWSHAAPGCRYGVRPLLPTADAAGNLFVGYTTERYDGVTVLRPTPDGLDDFASLPNLDVGGPTTMRFYDSVTYDTDDDGGLEIVQLERPCVPSCAQGQVYFRTYRWNGDDFFTELCTSPRRPGVPIQATAGAGGTLVGEIPAGSCGVESNVADWSVDTGWYAVWFDGRSGWSPVSAFELPPAEPPWPPDEAPYVTVPPTVPPPPAPPPVVPPRCASYSFNEDYPIQRCDEGLAVIIVQQSLVNLGFAVEVDGYFGPGTELAIRDFQSTHGLEVDGLVGPATWYALTGNALPGYDLDGNGIIDPIEVVYD